MAEETNHKPYRLGLALRRRPKGFAHIGVFRMMEECALRPDIIVGTSAGALMGTLFADGYSAAEIQELLPDVSSRNSPSCRFLRRVCSIVSAFVIS